jgi:hypothetical protein
MQEIFGLLMTSPQDFKGGAVWSTMVAINNALQPVGSALFVIFFLLGAMRSISSAADARRPETIFKMFIRFILTKTLITHGLEILLTIIAVAQQLIGTVIGYATVNVTYAVPPEVIEAAEHSGFFGGILVWIVALLVSIVAIVLCVMMIMTVYGRFFKLYMFIAVSPIPCAFAGGVSTQGTTVQFFKEFGAVCLQGLVVVFAFIIFATLSSSGAFFTFGILGDNPSPATYVLSYGVQLAFQLLLLNTMVKGSDYLVKRITGLGA